MATAHLVLAEDDRAVRDSLTRALELEGYEVEAVADGAAARDAAGRDGVDLLILDIGMPHVDGLTVCRRLRSAGSRLPILVLTARTEVSDRVSGLDAVPPRSVERGRPVGDRLHLVALELEGPGEGVAHGAVVSARTRCAVAMGSS
jgi:CheY-like chemotaxis protein